MKDNLTRGLLLHRKRVAKLRVKLILLETVLNQLKIFLRRKLPRPKNLRSKLLVLNRNRRRTCSIWKLVWKKLMNSSALGLKP